MGGAERGEDMLRTGVARVPVGDELLLLDRDGGRVVRLDAEATRRLASGADDLVAALDGLGMTVGTASRRSVLGAAALAGLGISVLALPSAPAAASGGGGGDGGVSTVTLDEAFVGPTFTGGTVFVSDLLVEPDGDVVFTGTFGYSSVAGSHQALGRVDANGTVDTGFRMEVNSSAETVTRLSDGRIVIGGIFSTVNSGLNGGNQSRLIAFEGNDGAVVPSYPPDNPNAFIRALATQTVENVEAIIVGGDFEVAGVTSRSRLARFFANGVLDTGFAQVSNAAGDRISALAVDADGRVLIGGKFTSVGGTARTALARLEANGALDTGFDANVQLAEAPEFLEVTDIVVQTDGRIVIGGSFTTVGGAAGSSVARLEANGAVDGTFTLSPNSGAGGSAGGVSLAVQSDGKILVGAESTTFDGRTRAGIARLHANGALDTSFDPGLDDAVYAIAVVGEPAARRIVIGGRFTTVGGVSRPALAQLLDSAD